MHKLFSKDTGETSTQDTFMGINTGEVGDNRGDNSVRTCEVNTLVNIAYGSYRDARSKKQESRLIHRCFKA